MYYLQVNNEIVGPISLIDLLNYEIQPDTLILIDDGISDWVQAKDLAELKDIFTEIETNSVTNEDVSIFKIKQGEEFIGSFELKDIDQSIINKDTLIWTEGMDDWQNAYEFLGLNDITETVNEVVGDPVIEQQDEPIIEQNSNTYFIKKINQARIGPLNIEQIREIGIDESTLIWTEGMPNWINAIDFLNSISSPPPLPPIGGGLGTKKLVFIAAVSILLLLTISFYSLPYLVKHENDIAEKIYNSYNKATVLIYNEFYYTVNIDNNPELYIGIDDGKLSVSKNQNDLKPLGITGSGFYVSDDGKIITNRHVAYPWITNSIEELQVEHPDVLILYQECINYLEEQGIDNSKINLSGLSSFVGVCENNSKINDIGDFKECITISYHKDYKIDLAKLQLKTKKLPKTSNFINLGNLGNIEDLKVGTKICVLGFPGGLDFQDVDEAGVDLKLIANAGEISKEVTSYKIMFNAASAGGASGSPVFNKDGQLIGVHHAGQKDKQGFNYAIVSKYILELD